VVRYQTTRRDHYRKLGYWGDATLAHYWQMALLSAPEKEAVVDAHGTRFTYQALDQASGKVAAYLRQAGVRAGDFVSVQLPGWAEFVVVYLGCLKAGAVINPICPGFRGKELSYILNKCQSKVLFLPAQFRGQDHAGTGSLLAGQVPSLRDVVLVDKEGGGAGTTLKAILDAFPCRPTSHARSADDLAAVLFTSGTEGFPKGVMLTHNNIIAAEKALAARVNFSSFDVLLMPSPMGHAIGFHHGVTLPMMFGAKTVLQDRFDPVLSLRLIEQERCTCGMGTTPYVYDMLRELEHEPYDISSLRFYLCGGAPVPRQMVQEAQLYGFKVMAVYGATESVPHTATSLEDPPEKVINTDGAPVPGVEVKVVDAMRQPARQGEEASRGPGVFVGYLDEPELTAKVLDAEGWYYSGDLCVMDDDGYIRITGRKKDIIIRGGENISSCEVENVLLQHPKVREAAVVPLPDPRLGERICAYLVLKDGVGGITLEEVRSFFAGLELSRFKHPERVEVLPQLPRTESGKVKKFLLLEDLRAKLPAELQREGGTAAPPEPRRGLAP